MKRSIIILGIIAILIGVWFYKKQDTTAPDQPKDAPYKTQVNSTPLNQSVIVALSAYAEMKNAFVDADSIGAKSLTQKFIAAVDSIKINDLQKDTIIYSTIQTQLGDVKSNAVAIAGESNLTEMRKDFQMVSENFYPFLKTIGYKGPKIYWQNCPMAFGEGKEASWISSSSEIINPYLGKKHPEYKATMLHCGIQEDSMGR